MYLNGQGILFSHWHLFSILSVMKHFVDFVLIYVVTKMVDVNVIIYWCQHIVMAKFWKTAKNDTIILSWHCLKQVLCRKHEEIFNSFLWQLLHSRPVEHIDIKLCAQAKSNFSKNFLLVSSSDKNFIVFVSIWCESWIELWYIFLEEAGDYLVSL